MEKSWANELWRVKIMMIALIPSLRTKHDDVDAFFVCREGWRTQRYGR